MLLLKMPAKISLVFINIAVLVAAGFLMSSNAFAAVLWSADFETGDVSQWYQGGGGDETNSGHYQNTAVSTEFAHSPIYSGKMVIWTDTNSGIRLMRWGEFQSYNSLYFSAWYYFPQHYDIPGGWWNIWQWKAESSGSSAPSWVINVGNRNDGTMYLYLEDCKRDEQCSSNPVNYRQSIANIPVNRWFQVEAFYHCAADNTGRVTIWQDGVQIFDMNNVQTNLPGRYCLWSVNNYADNIIPNPVVLYTDDAAIGTTRIGHVNTSPYPTPSFTISDLKLLLYRYLTNNTLSDYSPKDGKVNMLDVSYITKSL